MRTVLNLTIPLYPGMPVGSVWPADSAFRFEDITTYEKYGARLSWFSMHTETGTRLMYQAIHDPTAPTVERLDLGRFVGFEAVVVDIPKGEYAEISAEEVDRALGGAPDYRAGDAVLIRTGWGDGQRWKRIGEDYAIRSPHFSLAGAERTVEVMRARGSDTMLIDCAYVGNCGEGYMRREWASLPPWRRPNWPSEEARAYLRTYTLEKKRADWGSSRPLARGLFLVAALANCGAIRSRRVRITALPLVIENATGAPCTVVAEEI